jgi:hypothetical protein
MKGSRGNPGSHISGGAMIYLVGVSSKELLYYNRLYPQERLNLLKSYAYRSTDTARLLFDYRDLIGSIICDSGTYSLSANPEKLSKKITLRGYRSYLQQLGKYYDFYFNFDQDFSRDGFTTNQQNQLELEKAGLSPVPVVHDSYGPEIPYYIKKGYKMVAIGSGELQDGDVTELYRIVNKLYSKGIKVHLLGCTEYGKLAYTPVYSADSTTWAHQGARGHVYYWNPDRPGYNKQDQICFIYKKHGMHMSNHIDNHPQQLQINQYLKTHLNLSIDKMRGPKGSFFRHIANIHYYVQLDKRVAAEHRKQKFKYWI